MGSCGTLFKGLILLVTALLGLVGTSLVFFAGVTIYDLDLAQAKADKLEDKLQDFIKCDDIVADEMKNMTADENTRIVLTAGCQYKHTPSLTLFCVGGTFALFSVLSGLVSGCRDVKGNLYGYTVICGAALALLVVGLVQMNTITASVSTKWVPTCEAFSAQTKTNIESKGFLCIENNETALHWVQRVGLYYAGAVLTIISLLSFLLMNSCASGDARKGLQQQEVKQVGEYKAFNNGRGGQRA